MVTTGATVLMATSEGTSNGIQNNSTRYENQNICCHYNEVHNNQQNSECPIKKNITSCNTNSKYSPCIFKLHNKFHIHQFISLNVYY